MPRLDAQTVEQLRASLFDTGPEIFIRDYVVSGKYTLRSLGVVFGLDPHLYSEVGRALFLRLLQQLIVRHYYKRRKLPQYNTLDDVAKLLQNSKKIVVIAGAGISTSLGIPDFRSKNTGFYDKVREMDSSLGIGEPEDVFDIEIFDQSPEIFFSLAGDILPDEKKFSPTHAFIKLLQDKGKLLTCYTQNIDNLETSAGIKPEKLIQCHGSFGTATCRKNGAKNPAHSVPGTDIFDDIRQRKIPICKACRSEMEQAEAAKRRQKRFKLTPRKSTPVSDADSDLDDNIPQPGIMKPDITFFGEQLPKTFFDRFTDIDCKIVDLVLVIGTSLKVAPVSDMPNYLPHKVPHVYVNREAIEHVNFDVQCLGDCDDVVEELCVRAGWSGGLRAHEMVKAKAGRTIITEKAGDAPERWRVGRRS